MITIIVINLLSFFIYFKFVRVNNKFNFPLMKEEVLEIQLWSYKNLFIYHKNTDNIKITQNFENIIKEITFDAVGVTVIINNNNFTLKKKYNRVPITKKNLYLISNLQKPVFDRYI